jgi:hypothetical protein
MKTYTVEIETVEHYTVTVEAHDENDAEAQAWRLFPDITFTGGENNIVSVTEQGLLSC